MGSFKHANNYSIDYAFIVTNMGAYDAAVECPLWGAYGNA